MEAARFDALAKSLTTIRSRRGALRGLLLGTGSLLSLTVAQDATSKNCKKIKNKQKRKKCLAKAAPPPPVPPPVLPPPPPGPPPPEPPCGVPCGEGCCSANSCFAESVDPADREPLTFACCSAEQLCRSTDPRYPDQCCYPDETCDPTLVATPEVRTICCRPCQGGIDGCCLQPAEECINDVCTTVNTARLPRTRRPG